jgi:hypothetical protein
METLGLCKPASSILLISVAGALYHFLAGSFRGIIWWSLVGLFGTGVFQALCFGGLEPIAWTLMLIPVLIVCFFLAVALFASSMRIDNIMSVPCRTCNSKPCGCKPTPRPGCVRPAPCRCSTCSANGFANATEGFANAPNRCPLGACECPRCGGSGEMCPYCPGAPQMEGFADCGCNECKCIGGSCPGCDKGGCLDCGGAGCAYCAYANTVVSGTRFDESADAYYE